MNAPDVDRDPFPREPVLDRRQHVAAPHLDARIDDGWQRIRGARSDRRRARRRAWTAGVGVAGLAAAAALALVVRSTPAGPSAEGPSTWAGASLRTSAAEGTRVALADGSEIEAMPSSELALLDARRDEVRVALRRGGATFEVAPQRAGRRFVVEAGPVEVRVVGTRFSVRRGAHRRVTVVVDRGVVEVSRAGERRTLRAGERWEVTEVPDAAGADPLGADAVDPASAARPDGPGDQVVTSPAATRDDAPATAATGGDAPPPDRRGRRGPSVDGAAGLFADAATALRDGRPADAARAWERLVDRHPGDPRAPLAAFELGRLRMDRLGDPAGAVRALRRALVLGPRSPFREDARARLVRALEATGDTPACARARARYLEVHPDGRYAGDVSRRCQPGR